jgi:hypothetical protein
LTIVGVVDGTSCRAFLGIWHDIAAGDEAEFERWHTEEHMPERLALPGFARGRRGHAPGAARQRWVTLYEGVDLATFDSAAYRARLDDPTPWTTRLQPSFLNFTRVACETLATAGDGVGGATATLRLSLADDAREAFRRAGDETAAALLRLDGVSRVLVGLVRPEVGNARTQESALRGSVDPGSPDAVAVVDGVGERQLAAALPAIREIVEAVRPGTTVAADCVYTLTFLL